MRHRKKRHRLMRGANAGEEVVSAFSVPLGEGTTTGGSMGAGLGGAAGGAANGAVGGFTVRQRDGHAADVADACQLTVAIVPRYSRAVLMPSNWVGGLCTDVRSTSPVNRRILAGPLTLS